MGSSSIANDPTMGFEWSALGHGYVYCDYPEPKHLPPYDEAGRRAWLEGFLQSHAEYPNDPLELIDPSISEGAQAALRRVLAGRTDVDALLALLDRMLIEWRDAGEFRRMRL